MTNLICDLINIDQFEPGESAYECGFYIAALLKYAIRPGEKFPVTGETIDRLADVWYVEVSGMSNTPNNKSGMSLLQLYWTLEKLAGLPYHTFKVDMAWVKGFLSHGYPVVLAVEESSVFDVELGDKVPYAWKPSGNHIIAAVGLASDGNLLCWDTASIAPNGVRPGPRLYDANRLRLVSNTCVVLPWLAPIPSGFNPVETSDTHSYTIRPGDTLVAIASEHDTTLAILLHHNLEELDIRAREAGYPNSFGGNMIFPGSVLHW
jgi:hypothetical protein